MIGPRSLLPLSLLVAACGGTVVFEEDGGDGGGIASSATLGSGPTSGSGGSSSVVVGSSGQGGGTSVGPSGSTAGQGGGTSVGQGGSPSGQGGGGGAPPCSAIDVYTDCLAAIDQCVPVFDDFCCPSCIPGGCADCVDVRFVGCSERLPPEPGGGCTDTCGVTPPWACNGNPRPEACGAACDRPGCIDKIRCDIDACEVWCEPVRPDACSIVVCDAPPPPCAGDQVPEVADGCWTGACIPAWVCAPVNPPF